MYDAETRRLYPFLDLLESNVEIIRAEVLALDPNEFAPVHGYQEGCTGYVLEPGPWSKDFPGADFAAHRARCPKTTALLAEIGGIELGGFLKFEPGAKMGVHTDPRDDHIVRCHLGLRLCEDEQAWWPEGRARLMDTRQPHWARNDGDYPRITMCVDVRMPFVVPDAAWGPWRQDAPGELAHRGERAQG